MLRRSRLNSSHRAGLLALALAAVLLPLLILSVVQYRSLADLEAKTRVAVEENLRQTLQSVSRRARERLEGLAGESLGSIEITDVEQEKLDEIERRLTAIRQSHPEIELAFVVVNCSCRERNFALFSAPEGSRRVEHDRFKGHPEAQAAIDAHNNAHLLRASTDAGQSVLFEQSHCALFPGSGSDHLRELVFIPLHKTGGHGQIGFAGMALRAGYVREQLLPQVVGEWLRSSGSGPQDSTPVISVLDEQGREIYASREGSKQYAVKMAFTPVFRQWKLGIGYQGTTIEALARRHFRQNLAFTGLALLLLVCGLALTLRAAARELRLAEAKATFVSNVSHELKTPLALIRLFAETLELGRVKSPEKAQEYYRLINHESRRLTQLVNNILDFARIEAGRRQYRFVEANLAEVVEEVLQSYEYQMKSAGFEVKTEIEHHLPPVLIDRDAMAQVVLNLLNNAVKYSAEVKRIEVRVGARGNDLAVEVTDCGIGIPRAEQRKVFEKFYRVSTGLVHDTKGSGLGLTIVKHIVEAHHGRVLVESAPGAGSRFTILIPVPKAAAAAPEELHPGAGGYSVAENPHH
jgi:signal transduction histidine kinase